MKQNKIPRNEYIRKPVGKTNPYKHDVLYTNLGQWKYPGQVTRIPSNDITMQGVPYPVYGEDDLGYGQMMYPGMDYTFPGQYVTEIPMAQDGEEINDPYFSKGYWKDPNTRSKNLVQKQVKKPENIIIQKPYVSEIPTYLKKNKQQFKEIPLSNNIEDRDSWLENIAEVFDPTGISSWDDVYRAYKNTGLSGETALEALGAIPLLGKIGKSGKIIAGGFGLLQDAVKASKYLPASKQQKFINKAFDMYQKYNKAGGKELDEALGATTKILRDKIPYINPNKWSSSDKAINMANKSFKAGRLSDAVQAALGAKDDSGFTWDIRHGEVPKFGGRNIFPQIELGEHGDFAYGGIPMAQNGIEKKVNKWLGEPMKKAQQASKGDKWFNPDTKRWEQEDDVDNYRHPMAGMYTSQAITNKFPSWMKYTGIPQAAGFLGANALGIAHEVANPNSDPNYSWWDVVREAGEDIFNNAVGAGVGTLPISDDKKSDILWNLSKNNRLPDGYAKANMYFKAYGGDPSLPNITGHYKTGGWLDEYQTGGRVMPSETTQSFIPAGLRYKMDQLKKQDPKQKQKLAEEKKYYENIAKAKEDARKQEVADRKARIADSIEAQKESVIGNPNWREVLARQTQATGDKFRVSDEPNFFDDYINPGVWVGDMASGLGQAPYAAKESNSNLPYALAVGTPLLTGALEGIGGKSTKDFLTNIISPVPFTGEMINKGLNKIGKTSKNAIKYFNKETSTAPFRINVEPNTNISADFNKKVEDVIQKNIDRVKSDTYKKRRMANTGETEEKVDKSINKYIKNIKKAKFNFPNYGPKSTAEGVYYQPGSLFGLDLGRHKINVHTVGKTEDDILEVLDHEIKHMLSPLSKNSEYKLYKNYPLLEINPTIKNKDYYLLPEEQQVRFNRLNEKIRKDLNINKENLSLEDILYWNKNYQDDVLKGPKGYSDMRQIFKAAKNPISATTLKNVLNKSWAVLPAAIATGAYKALVPGAIATETYQQQEEGGEIEDEFRRGGLYTPPKIKRKAKKYGTSKNIQSSINKLFTRNYDVFGPGGKNIYNPKAYKTGGWLDNMD